MRGTAILALLSLLIMAQPAWAGIGRIKKVTGDVQIERAGQRIPATSGLTLEKGDRIITGKGAKVGVTFNDNSRIAVGQNSQLSIPEFSFDDTSHQGQFLTEVQKGTVAIVSGHIAKSAKDAMKVRTPTALLGVRGTKFVVEVR